MNKPARQSTFFFLLGCTMSLLFSCTKPNDPSNPPQGISILSPFRVTVLDRTVSQASIIWTESLNLGSYDTVKYKVVINNRVVDSNLTRRYDTLRNLSGDTAYAGVVWAYTKSGDTSSATFSWIRCRSLLLLISRILLAYATLVRALNCGQ